MKGLYTFMFEGKEISLRFTTWVFREYSATKSMSVDEFLNEVVNGMISSNDIIDMMLLAAKYSAIKKGEQCNYTNVDACDWYDELGGITGTKTMEMVCVLMGALINKDPAELVGAVKSFGGEKKSV